MVKFKQIYKTHMGYCNKLFKDMLKSEEKDKKLY